MQAPLFSVPAGMILHFALALLQCVQALEAYWVLVKEAITGHKHDESKEVLLILDIARRNRTYILPDLSWRRTSISINVESFIACRLSH